MPTNNFTPNMPAAGNSLGFTRPLVNGNFGNYRENLEVNHFNVNSADFGKHKFLQIPNIETQAISVPTTANNEGAIYTKKAPSNTNETQLYYRRESNGDEFGTICLSGSVVFPSAIGNYLIKDFSSYSVANGVHGLYGKMLVYNNAAISQVNMIINIFVTNGTYYFSNEVVVGTGVIVGARNFGSANVNITFGNPASSSDPNLYFNVVSTAGLTAGTLTWKFVGHAFI